MSTTVHVKGISAQTPEKEVRDFFSFCGKIASLKLTTEGDSQSATVDFEKETAAKTALLLDNTQLGPSQVHVTSDSSSAHSSTTKEAGTESEHDVAQEDKPRARILAEYLAHGYVISDKVIEKGLALDQQHGISNRFTSALKNFDEKYQATEKTRGIDQQYGVTNRAGSAWAGLNSYFEKAINTPNGQKLRDFYVQTSKQVLDVHNEARHLANLKTGKPSPTTESATPATGSSSTAEAKAAEAASEKTDAGPTQ